MRRDTGLGASEVDESLLHVSADELRAKLVAHIESLLALGEQSLDVRLQHANESSVIGHTSDDGVEDFANPVLHGHGSEALRHFTLNFSCSVLLLRTVGGDGCQFVIGVRILLAS